MHLNTHEDCAMKFEPCCSVAGAGVPAPQYPDNKIWTGFLFDLACRWWACCAGGPAEYGGDVGLGGCVPPGAAAGAAGADGERGGRGAQVGSQCTCLNLAWAS